MPNWLPEAASTFAGDIDRLMIFITIVVGVWFVAAELYLVYSALRFRRRKGVHLGGTPLGSLDPGGLAYAGGQIHHRPRY